MPRGGLEALQPDGPVWRPRLWKVKPTFSLVVLDRLSSTQDADLSVNMDQVPYVYDNLEPGHIRLVRVVTCTDDAVECEIRQVPLKTTEPWYALSYVWGTEVGEHAILLNGHRKLVRPNLFAALKAIHNAPSSDPDLPCHLWTWSHLWVWIDGLCINQDDNEEKSCQIPIMGELYSRAKSVFVWLGDDHDPSFVDVLVRIDARIRLDALKYDDNRAFWLKRLRAARPGPDAPQQVTESEIEVLYSLYEHTIRAMKHDMQSPSKAIVDNWVATHDKSSVLLPSTHFFWAGLEHFIDNRWHTRIWTYQEICMANDAKLILPNDSIAYSPIALFASISAIRRKTEDFASDGYYQTASVIGQLHSLSPARSLIGLARHINWTIARHATEPRDYIYALLAIMSSKEKENICVDYARPLAAVFTDFMYAAVLNDADMLPHLWETYATMIRAHHSAEPATTLPSWCPHFENRTFDSKKHLWGGSLPSIAHSVRFRYNSYARAKSVSPYPTLSFSAWQLDKVSRASTPDHVLVQPNDSGSDSVGAESTDMLYDAVESVIRWLQPFDSSFPWAVSGDSAAQMLRLIRLLNRRFRDKVQHSEQTKAAVMLLKLCHAIGEPDAWAEQTEELSTKSYLDLTFNCVIILQENAQRSTIVETCSGKLGLAASPVSVGDLVVYVPGGGELHVLSSDGRHYRSAAKVEGYMEDDLLPILESRVDDLETFYVT